MIVAHDPRAPKLAAGSILLALFLIAAAAANSQLNVVGQSGIGLEEIGLLIAALILGGLAKWANTEHAIPEFNASTTKATSVFEDFDDVRTPISARTTSYQQGTTSPSNQTTANILSSILGQEQQTNEEDVRSAISTLSTGEFGMRAQEEAKTTEFAQEDNHRRDSAPTNAETGAALTRVVVQPVPLPGRENTPVVDPTSIPGLEHDRVFVTEGVNHVPLPVLPEIVTEVMHVEPIVEEIHIDPTPSNLPELPELPMEAATQPLAPALPDLPAPEVMQAALPDLSDLDDAEITLTSSPELPNLDDLFAEPSPAMAPSVPDTPDLPDLDDLF